ncbi:CvpA family protein [Tenacibaculum finnmarkense genomovar finnmarkense]|uniref:Colicin V production protein n=2 Tax=Tenacibaculum finnmarkense TaxID=2781243 RepID=A0A2I2M961_9FLAO|nr:CvpA family protein [Tenacibaculum finnmarkense]MBE7633235.1 CvpA family protein [Tenacibaculum finnmarkense genomovar ulcerans]MBE7652085.1 CvpA family protein [Tenacibaculum finnmarkense genomovar finnmarkense]MBE7659620.1 CvpA family protein [Tenacibaculum finnmarkense genomovar finnmarkense]MBE7691824.1 CvpA family protein [Tenacibaculum finnmarkense genomovar finnmarkense]MBE7694200.1 CvpA family protein [Tenacibaculum finnmarkense genomovar finnmarkense]
MNIFDIIIAVLLIFGFVRGILKGLFVEVASLVALIAGVYGAMHFSYFISDWLASSVSWDEKYISLTAFAGTFIVIIIVISLLGKVLTKVADFASLGILNKILGGVFGALKIGLILSVAFIFFGKMNDTIPFVTKENLAESILYSPVKKIAPMIFPSIIKED